MIRIEKFFRKHSIFRNLFYFVGLTHLVSFNYACENKKEANNVYEPFYIDVHHTKITEDLLERAKEIGNKFSADNKFSRWDVISTTLEGDSIGSLFFRPAATGADTTGLSEDIKYFLTGKR